MVMEVEAFPMGEAVGDGTVGEGSWVSKVSIKRPAGAGGVFELERALDAGVGPVFAVEGDTFEVEESVGPAGGVAEEVSIEEDVGVWLGGSVGRVVEGDGDAFIGDIGGLVGDFYGGGEEGAVVHGEPGFRRGLGVA